MNHSQYPADGDPAVKRRRRKDPRQTTFAFRPTGRGGARPRAGRPRTRRSRVPHRSREAIPGDRPVLVTLRVADDVPALRRARFVRAFRETLRRGAERTGFRVVHYSVQDNHAHFLVEADDKEKLANGMKSLGARFARCVNRVFGRRGRRPPVALDAASSGRWFDGWSTSPPAGGRYADAGRVCEVAAPRTWLLATGWQLTGLVDPAEVPGFATGRRRARGGKRTE